MKKCTKCKLIKSKNEFQKQKCKADGLRYNCKTCRAAKSEADRANYSIERKEEISNKQKIRHYTRSEEQIKIDRRRNNEVSKNRYATDINFRLAHILRCRLREAIKNNQKTGSAINDLGCSIEEFKQYLESKFEPWMNWDNQGNYDKNRPTWQIDHIKALANFDLTNREELLKACNFSNMRPLLTIDNIIKSNR